MNCPRCHGKGWVYEFNTNGKAPCYKCHGCGCI